MAAPAMGLRYWCSRRDSTPGREHFHSQGYGTPRLKHGCAYCRAPLTAEAGQWVVFTRDPATAAYTQEVPGCRFPGQKAAERRVQQKLAAEGYSPGFVARWVAQPADPRTGPRFADPVAATEEDRCGDG